MSLSHHQDLVVHPQYQELTPFLQALPQLFAQGQGEVIHNGRNQLRKFAWNGKEYVAKSYHRPHFVNQLVYGTIRPSKAKRAYENALLFQQLGVGTPQPVGYLTIRKGLLFDQSYFVTEASLCQVDFGILMTTEVPYMDEVLKEVARTTAVLHSNGYRHLDYGRGNILFRLDEGQKVRLDVIDLNRVAVGKVDVKSGCKNFERLPATPHMHRVMADTYAALRGFDKEECYTLMKAYRTADKGKEEY